MSSFESLIDQNQSAHMWPSFRQMKCFKFTIFALTFLVLLPLVTHYYLTNVESFVTQRNRNVLQSQINSFGDGSSVTAAELKLRINEMLRIKETVSSELRELELRRQKLQTDIRMYTLNIDQLKQDLMRQKTELDRLKISVEQAEIAQKEAILRNTPELALPKPLYPSWKPPIIQTIDQEAFAACRMSSCFDHSRCSLTSGFPVYLYNPDQYSVMNDGYSIDSYIKTTIKQTLGFNLHLIDRPTNACMYIVLAGESVRETHSPGITNNRYINSAASVSNSVDDDGSLHLAINVTKLHSLPYWGGDGRNHMILNFARRQLHFDDEYDPATIGRAMRVQSNFGRKSFREGFDMVVPPALGPPGGDVWHECAYMIPARRKYLISFQGELSCSKLVPEHKNDTLPDESDNDDLLDNFIVDHLREMAVTLTQDKFLFQFECVPATYVRSVTGIRCEWSLCGTESSRKMFLRESTFALLLVPKNGASSTLFQMRMYEALRAGAIPVILGGDLIQLPYGEQIDWRRICILLPKARITELHFLLRAIPDPDLLTFRRQGRMIWERYMSTVQSVVDSVIASVRDRLGIPPLPVQSMQTKSVFNSTFSPLKADPPVTGDAEPEESLGPIEPPYDSPAFKRNYTVPLLQSYVAWNEWGDPFYLYPQMPFDPILPSDAKFLGSHTGFRPIGKGAGGAGKEFSEALGGNYPREQFTIVILTYEREQVLMDSLGRLYGLPYLHKVIVVWNSPKPPLEDLKWPDIGVPVVVAHVERNSLNNRFLPFDAIETEAILSVDDDAHLRHDEILFGFRVWREHRDRIVGFPGRFHAWDVSGNNFWHYNSNYSCELSMVLTGAAFFHKYYTFLYTNWLPQAIRDKVDEYMNCEDIAMNFLISHITRKPPVKVTSRWTFRCPGCPVSLSEDDTHFHERHKCINFFTKVFGYTPLLNTQFRADSILFKTRIPHDKQKCFKFI